MKRELDQLLCKKYPKIFRDRHADMHKTLMCWGFECHDGWFNIIDKMCSVIQWHIDQSRNRRLRSLRYNRAVKRALHGDIEALIKFYSTKSPNSRKWAESSAQRDIAAGLKFQKVHEACPQVVAVQVKEKFGTLSFYTEGGDDYTRGVESLAESMSAVTCEICGSPGKIRGSSWLYTACDQHTDEQDKQGNNDETQESH